MEDFVGVEDKGRGKKDIEEIEDRDNDNGY